MSYLSEFLVYHHLVMPTTLEITFEDYDENNTPFFTIFQVEDVQYKIKSKKETITLLHNKEEDSYINFILYHIKDNDLKQRTYRIRIIKEAINQLFANINFDMDHITELWYKYDEENEENVKRMKSLVPDIRSFPFLEDKKKSKVLYIDKL